MLKIKGSLITSLLNIVMFYIEYFRDYLIDIVV